jgi:hypothetical protein
MIDDSQYQVISDNVHYFGEIDHCGCQLLSRVA